jgi:predicted phosphodiesterase
MPLPVIEATGLVLIGDPHLTSNRPARRLDRDFRATVIGNLEQAIDIANELDAQAVCLGDLTDDPDEKDQWLIANLFRVLRKAKYPVIHVLGNSHDKRHNHLTDDTALGIVRMAGVINVVEQSGPVAILKLGHDRQYTVRLGATPHGIEVPKTVTGMFNGEPEGYTIWITHHDWAFEATYPGAMALHEIAGVDLMVNGHIHGTKKPVTLGRMTAFNPGNIIRLSIDLIDHVEAVWPFAPDENGAMKLTRRALSFERDLFDLTGYQVTPSRAKDAVQDMIGSGVEAAQGGGRGGDEVRGLQAPAESAFVDLLRAEAASEMKRSSDGSLLRQDIESLFEEMKTPAPLRAMILELQARAAAALKAEA